MGLSKLMRAALTVNPLARTSKAKDLAKVRTQLEKILQEGSDATAAQKATARRKLNQMDRVEARENVQRSTKASKNAPESSTKKKKLAPPNLKSLEGLPDNFNVGGVVKSRTGAQDYRSGGMVLSSVDNRKKR